MGLGDRISSVNLLEAVFEQYAPGGVAEKTSLTTFLRGLPTAKSFTEVLATLRRLRLAKARAELLKLPPIPAHEMLQSLNAVVRDLERRTPTLSTRLSTARLQPDVLVPTDTGVVSMCSLLESEARRLSADEVKKGSVDTHNAVDYEVEQQAANAARGVCHFFGTAEGCKRENCQFLHAPDPNAKGNGKGKGKGAKGQDGKGKGKGKGDKGNGKGKGDTKPDNTTNNTQQDPSKQTPDANAKAKQRPRLRKIKCRKNL